MNIHHCGACDTPHANYAEQSPNHCDNCKNSYFCLPYPFGDDEPTITRFQCMSCDTTYSDQLKPTRCFCGGTNFSIFVEGERQANEKS